MYRSGKSIVHKVENRNNTNKVKGNCADVCGSGTSLMVVRRQSEFKCVDLKERTRNVENAQLVGMDASIVKLIKMFFDNPQRVAVFFTQVDIRAYVKQLDILCGFGVGFTTEPVILCRVGNLADCLAFKDVLLLSGITNPLAFTLNHRGAYSHVVTTAMGFSQINAVLLERNKYPTFSEIISTEPVHAFVDIDYKFEDFPILSVDDMGGVTDVEIYDALNKALKEKTKEIVDAIMTKKKCFDLDYCLEFEMLTVKGWNEPVALTKKYKFSRHLVFRSNDTCFKSVGEVKYLLYSVCRIDSIGSLIPLEIYKKIIPETLMNTLTSNADKMRVLSKSACLVDDIYHNNKRLRCFFSAKSDDDSRIKIPSFVYYKSIKDLPVILSKNKHLVISRSLADDNRSPIKSSKLKLSKTVMSQIFCRDEFGAGRCNGDDEDCNVIRSMMLVFLEIGSVRVSGVSRLCVDKIVCLGNKNLIKATLRCAMQSISCDKRDLRNMVTTICVNWDFHTRFVAANVDGKLQSAVDPNFKSYLRLKIGPKTYYVIFDSDDCKYFVGSTDDMDFVIISKNPFAMASRSTTSDGAFGGGGGGGGGDGDGHNNDIASRKRKRQSAFSGSVSKIHPDSKRLNTNTSESQRDLFAILCDPTNKLYASNLSDRFENGNFQNSTHLSVVSTSHRFGPGGKLNLDDLWHMLLSEFEKFLDPIRFHALKREVERIFELLLDELKAITDTFGCLQNPKASGSIQSNGVIFFQNSNKRCFIKGLRLGVTHNEHKSNHSFLVVDLKNKSYSIACHDDECKEFKRNNHRDCKFHFTGCEIQSKTEKLLRFMTELKFNKPP